MKKKLLATIAVLAALPLTMTACGKANTYKQEITDAWTKTNSYESASYSYQISYTNEDGIQVNSVNEGAYNRTEETWSQISDYGTQGIGKQEEVLSPEEIHIRYDLDGSGWGDWGKINSERTDYASFLKTLFEQNISFENIDSIEKAEENGEIIYTLTYKKSYMRAQVEEELEAARDYLELLQETSSDLTELDTLEQEVESLERRAEATGQAIYYVDKEGNLTGLGSRIEMEGGAGTYIMLRLSEFGEVSFEGYTENP